jgi:hypothetical protein
MDVNVRACAAFKDAMGTPTRCDTNDCVETILVKPKGILLARNDAVK